MRLPKLTFANAIALIALFVSLGGTVYAAAKIDGKTIKKGSIPANRLKADSLGGTQVKESALGQVPSAARADSAATAGSATRADAAGRAESAGRADAATKATKAAVATEAEHAKAADTAVAADNALTLAGRPASAYRRNCGDPGAVQGLLIFDGGSNQKLSEFSCNDEEVRVTVLGPGEFRVRFPEMRSAPMALAAAPGFHSSVAAEQVSTEPEFFTVRTFSTVDGGALPRETFSLAIFASDRVGP